MTASFPSPSYATMPLQRKYDMMHSGPGGAAAVPAADTLGKLAPDFNASADAVQRVLSSIGVNWEGQAATAFTGAMRQAGQWAQQQGSQTSQSGGGQVHTYASSYDATKAKIPDPRTLAPVGEPSVTDRFMDWSGARSAPSPTGPGAGPPFRPPTGRPMTRCSRTRTPPAGSSTRSRPSATHPR